MGRPARRPGRAGAPIAAAALQCKDLHVKAASRLHLLTAPAPPHPRHLGPQHPTPPPSPIPHAAARNSRAQQAQKKCTSRSSQGSSGRSYFRLRRCRLLYVTTAAGCKARAGGQLRALQSLGAVWLSAHLWRPAGRRRRAAAALPSAVSQASAPASCVRRAPTLQLPAGRRLRAAACAAGLTPRAVAEQQAGHTVRHQPPPQPRAVVAERVARAEQRGQAAGWGAEGPWVSERGQLSSDGTPSPGQPGRTHHIVISSVIE